MAKLFLIKGGLREEESVENRIAILALTKTRFNSQNWRKFGYTDFIKNSISN